MVHSLLEGATAFVGFDAQKESIENYFLCDGTADDVQINAALSHADSMGGGVVMIKAGSYDITSTILTPGSNLSLIGSGWNAVLTLANGVDDHMFYVTATGTTIRDLKMCGNNANNATLSHGIYVYRSASHRFINLKIYDFQDDDIHLGENTWEPCLGGKITRCYLGDTTNKTTGNGLYVDYSATDWEIWANVMAEHETAGKAGMVMDGSNNNTWANHFWGNYYHVIVAPANHVNGWLSNGDKFMDNKRHGIYKPTGYWWKNGSIIGAYFWWNGQDTADTYDSISTAGDVRCIEVQANFRGENDAGTHITRFIWNADADVDQCRVTGIVEGYNEAAPVVFAGAGCDQDLIIFDCS